MDITDDCDILIIGAGIAGASLAARLAGARDVMLLEAESQAGYHATGRSAAFWHETCGGVLVSPLTIAAKALLESPPQDMGASSFLSPRSAITLARQSESSQLEEFITSYEAAGVSMTQLSGEALTGYVPGLRPEWCLGAREADCSDIDVARLHAAFLKKARSAGAQLKLNCAFKQARWSKGGWEVETNRGRLRARTLVNAAGAWAENVAVQSGIDAIKIRPLRRTVAQLRLNTATPAQIPLVIHVGGDFYFKGVGEGRVWLSPHDETPSTACDAAPHELDIAVAIDRFQSVVDWEIANVEHKWAGLRSFSPDRLPIFGRDPLNPEFVWCAGQGGFGIQTSASISALLAEQLGATAVAGYDSIDSSLYSPTRFR